MSFRTSRLRLYGGVVLLWLWPCLPAHAYWGSNGVPLTAAIGWQGNLRIATDGAGGAIGAWQDERDFLATDDDIYARRVGAQGNLPLGWLPQGVPLCTDSAYQAGPDIASDGAGGAYVVWEDRRGGFDLFLQRVTAEGAVANWPLNGIPVCQAPRFQLVPRLVPDAEGGVFIVWEDFRTGTTNSELYAQRITAEGQRAPGWPVDGLAVCTAPGGRRPFRTISDGHGGLYVAWSDLRDQASMADIYVQRLLSDGTIAPGWPVNGVAICSAPEHQAHTALALDPAGGLYVAWNDSRNMPAGGYFEDYWDIFVQRVTADGGIAPGWPADGLAVCTEFFHTQYDHSIVADGAGGAIIAWADYRNYEFSASDLYGQRVLPSGMVAWAMDGVPLSQDPRFQHYPTLVADGTGGALISFQTGGGANLVFAQRVRDDGSIAAGWSPDGIQLCDFIGQHRPVATTDMRGGMIVAWEDERGGIWAQQVSGDYPTTTLVSFAGSSVEPGRVVLTWLAGPTVSVSARVYRRQEMTDWVALGTPRQEDRDRLVFEDEALPPGRYAYRLGYATAAGDAFTPEEWVTVPSGSVLALAGFQPNPAVGAPSVSLSLASGEDASLQIFDASGRVVAEERLGPLGAGRHVVPLGLARWSPGLYWLRLTQGSRSLTAKGMVVR